MRKAVNTSQLTSTLLYSRHSPENIKQNILEAATNKGIPNKKWGKHPLPLSVKGFVCALWAFSIKYIHSSLFNSLLPCGAESDTAVHTSHCTHARTVQRPSTLLSSVTWSMRWSFKVASWGSGFSHYQGLGHSYPAAQCKLTARALLSLVFTSTWIFTEVNGEPEHDQNRDECDSLLFHKLNFHSRQSLRNE